MKTSSLFLLAWRYLMHRRFATLVSVGAIALSLAFVVGLGVVNFAVKKTAVESSIRYPLIVGPEKASGVQLILSTVFHIDKPAGTIPFSVYENLKADSRVTAAYPVAVADTYKNIRIIGTNADFLKNLGVGVFEGSLELSAMEDAVFGFQAAKRTGVRLGDRFKGQHGMVGSAGAHEHGELEYRVAGVLNPTGGPEDTAIFTQYQSVWFIHAAHHHGHGHEHGHHAEHAEAEHHAEHGEQAHGEHAHGEDAHGKDAHAEHVKAKHHAERGDQAHEEHAKTEHHAEHGKQAHKKHAEAEHHTEHGEQGHEQHAETEHHTEHAEHAHAEDGHDKHAHGEHDKYTLSKGRLTAVLVRTGNPAFTGMLEREYSLKDGSLAVDTARSIREFVAHINKGEVFIEAVGMGMLLIALALILVTLVMSLNERRKELALLRSLGVGRATLAGAVMLETLFVTLAGALSGLAAGHLLAVLLRGWIRQAVGVDIEALVFTRMEGFGLLSTLLAGQVLALVGLFLTYRMNLVEETARD